MRIHGIDPKTGRGGRWRGPHRLHSAALLALTAALTLTGITVADHTDPMIQPFANPSGEAQTYTPAGFIDTTNPFFRSMGTNGRACVTCHQPSDGWSITPAHVQARFQASGGLDPIFRPVDGAVAPSADVSTVAARWAAYSMLLTKGLIRVGIGVPANAQFTLTGVQDPYHYASARELSLFRRPLPATNLPFLSAVMWDGRETVEPITGANSGQALQFDLMHQALDATMGHAQAASAPNAAELQQIASFEKSLYTAQVWDTAAGNLEGYDSGGGPWNLSRQPYYIGTNDPLGQNPTGTAFDPVAFTLADGWAHLDGDSVDAYAAGSRQGARTAWQQVLRTAARQSIARGQAIFNSRRFTITGVGGLNDALGAPGIVGTCTTCHDTPNVGNHSVSAPLNIGISDYPPRAGLDVQGLPVYTLRCDTSGTIVQTTDPGRALISGKCADIGKFKGPILRGLAARAPYFHNGSATTLNDVVTFYNNRFSIGLSEQDRTDLVAFLRSL